DCPVGGDIDLGREGVGGENAAYGIGADPDPGAAMIQGPGEAHVRSVVPHVIHMAMKEASGVAVASGPLLVFATAAVDAHWRGPGFSGVGGFVDLDADRIEGWGIVSRKANKEDVSGIVPSQGGISEKAKARHRQRRRIVPRQTAIGRVYGR